MTLFIVQLCITAGGGVSAAAGSVMMLMTLMNDCTVYTQRLTHSLQLWWPTFVSFINGHTTQLQ